MARDGRARIRFAPLEVPPQPQPTPEPPSNRAQWRVAPWRYIAPWPARLRGKLRLSNAEFARIERADIGRIDQTVENRCQHIHT